MISPCDITNIIQTAAFVFLNTKRSESI